MQMNGEQMVAAARQDVWAALNDPAVLAQCIPGCQSLERDGDNRFVAAAEVKIGPIGARFRGNVELSDLDPPNGYTISGSGNGGIAGSAKGGAKVRLADAAGGGTLIAYEVEADVGGRMAQLGGPIIDATAKNLAAKFFVKFGEVVGGGAQPAPAAAAAPVAPSSGIAPVIAVGASASGATSPVIWGWIAALLAVLIAGFVLGRTGASAAILLPVAVAVLVAAAAGFEAGRRTSSR